MPHGLIRNKFEICTGAAAAVPLPWEMPSGYGQFCPIAKAAEILTERWTPLVLRELLAGSHRFNEIRNGVPLMSPSLLASRLRSLERAGVVRRAHGETSGRREYYLTPAGEAFRPIIEQMGVWGMRHGMDLLTRRDLDPVLLMWSILRQVRSAGGQLPPARVVVAFRFPDAPRKKRYWWLVIEGPEVDLCLSDPGFPVDVELEAELLTMVQLLLHEMPYGQALRSQQIAVRGPRPLRRELARWLGWTAGAA